MTSCTKIRSAGLLGLALSVACFAACNKVLEVQNPSQIPFDSLNNKRLVDVFVAGAIGEFVHMYDDPFIWRGSMITDEQVTGINWEQTARLNLRIVRYDE